MIAEAVDRGLSGSFFGNGGNDVLTVNDVPQGGGNMLLNGGDGNDRITTNVLMDTRTSDSGEDTLTGGRGDDTFNINLDFPDGTVAAGEINIATITDFNRGTNTINITTAHNDGSGVAFDGLELVVAEDGSYTDIIANYTSLTDGVPPTQAVIRVLDVDDLSLSDINLSTGDSTTAGDDYISSGGVLNQPATISGGLGDDLLLHEGRDDAGGLVMEGGIGNDTLIADEIEFSNATTLDGGSGDDLLVTQLFTTPTTLDTVDTFITGSGADTVEISSVFDNLEGDSDFGIAARVTDFTPGEDIIVIDTAPISNGPTAAFTQTVELIENTGGDYTDVRYVVTNTENGATFSGFVRLEGLTDLSEDDIGVSLSASTDRFADTPSYLYSETSET